MSDCLPCFGLCMAWDGRDSISQGMLAAVWWLSVESNPRNTAQVPVDSICCYNSVTGPKS